MSDFSLNYLRLPFEEMEAIAKRFENRVGEGLKKAPPTREVVKKAVRRQSPAYCPCRLNRLSADIIVQYGDSLADLFFEYPDDIVFVNTYHGFVGYQPADKKDKVIALKVLMTESRWTDEWGTTWAHAFGGVGGNPVGHPITDWAHLDDYIRRQVPNANAPGRLDSAAALINAYKPDKYCMGTIQATLFERLYFVRGMENIFEDMYLHEKEVRRLADAIMEYNLEFVKLWGRLGPDGLLLTDDWGTQTSLMISPEMWRKIFKPYYKTLFDAIHREGMDVCLHSCGNVTQIVGDLIDIGLDILDPLQPEAVDLKEIARRFGGHITFHGAVDDQRLLNRATPRELKDNIRRLIETLGKPFGNGYILCPATSISPETPLENLRALFEACHER